MRLATLRFPLPQPLAFHAGRVDVDVGEILPVPVSYVTIGTVTQANGG